MKLDYNGFVFMKYLVTEWALLSYINPKVQPQ